MFSQLKTIEQDKKNEAEEADKDIQENASLLANQQTSKEVKKQISKLAKPQMTKEKKKYGTYLRDDSIHEIQILAINTRRKDNEVLQEIVDTYFRKPSK